MASLQCKNEQFNVVTCIQGFLIQKTIQGIFKEFIDKSIPNDSNINFLKMSDSFLFLIPDKYVTIINLISLKVHITSNVNSILLLLIGRT